MPIDIENFIMIQGHKKTGIKPNVVANTVILTPFSKHDQQRVYKIYRNSVIPESGIQDCSQIWDAFLNFSP